MDLNGLSDSGQLLIVGLMFIGGSPGSTAGGVKTTAVAVMLLTIWTEFRSRKDLELFNRRVEEDAIRHAACIIMLYGVISVLASMAISAIEGIGMKKVIFEVVSAICTVGLSLGITPQLGTISHIILILLMFIGRVGGITLLLAFGSRISHVPSKLPTEKVSVG